MNYDTIIIELLSRVQTLEKKVEKIEKLNCNKFNYADENDSNGIEFHQPDNSASVFGQRDKTHYLFMGKIYCKNRLVLAIVQQYVNEHPDITYNELKKVFDDSLQGSLGVVESLINAQLYCSDYEKRFFVKTDELIKLVDKSVCVCTQWGIGNINKFVCYAKKLGYEIISQ